VKLGVALLSLCALLALPTAAGAADPVLTGDVGANDSFTITMKDAAGVTVSHLEKGSYTLVVHDRSDFHNFHLSGPGVDVATAVDAKGDFTFTVSLTDGTYFFNCDPHSAQMKGTFTVGAVAAPPAATPVPATPVKLVAAIGPGANVSLKPTTGLSAGSVVITVRDRSATDGFRLAGPGVAKATATRFKGTVTWRVTLKAGSYTFGSALRAKLRRSFTVAN
jgi:plastocyanin